MKTTNPRSRRSVKWLILLVFLAAALYFYRGSLAEILEGIRALSFVQLIISCLIATVFFLIEGGIVYYMAHPFESTYHWGKGIRTAYLKVGLLPRPGVARAFASRQERAVLTRLSLAK